LAHSISASAAAWFLYMAFRLDQAIVKGEIVNTERGRVRDLIWLCGLAMLHRGGCSI
jgi:hypothetical protein